VSLYEQDRLLIGGDLVPPATPDRIEVVNPATERVVGHAAAASNHDVDRAVRVAVEAFDTGPWRWADLGTRAALVEEAVALLAPQAAALGELVTAEMGLPIRWSVRQLGDALRLTRAYLDAARGLTTEELRPLEHPALVVWEPIGVAAAISPWNGPLMSVLGKIVPALLAGCPVILKPAVQTPLDAFAIAGAFVEAGLPPGLLSVLPAGPETSEYLVGHAAVDFVSFTGTTEVGRRVAAACGGRLARTQLELGGKSAAIVLDDADLVRTAKALQAAAFGNSGQVCMALSRVLVPRRQAGEMAERLRGGAEAMVVGDPTDPATALGPLANRAQRDRVEHYIALGRSEGARIVSGGGRPPGLEQGWYVEPTVFADAHNGMRIARDEIFGPVVAVIAYDSVDDAVAMANDSDFGLHGAVFTEDDDRALAVARRVRSGTFTINGFVMNTGAPAGGMKRSGIGREFGPEGIRAYQEQKTINLGSGPE
jgi:acyl-CoA reductase-like NAD-dependent aldehyde dehydrogenase